MVKPNREDRNVPTEGWSDWKRAIVPGEDLDGHYTKRNGTGYYCNNIEAAFVDYNCGIYEWKAVHEDGNYVVYVGCTCTGRGGPIAGDLERRIMEYCTHGSHKKDDINRALDMGYELHVRVKDTGEIRVDAEHAENGMLAKYNYAWNIRGNFPYRGINIIGIPPQV